MSGPIRNDRSQTKASTRRGPYDFVNSLLTGVSSFVNSLLHQGTTPSGKIEMQSILHNYQKNNFDQRFLPQSSNTSVPSTRYSRPSSILPSYKDRPNKYDIYKNQENLSYQEGPSSYLKSPFRSQALPVQPPKNLDTKRDSSYVSQRNFHDGYLSIPSTTLNYERSGHRSFARNSYLQPASHVGINHLNNKINYQPHQSRKSNSFVEALSNKEDQNLSISNTKFPRSSLSVSHTIEKKRPNSFVSTSYHKPLRFPTQLSKIPPDQLKNAYMRSNPHRYSLHLKKSIFPDHNREISQLENDSFAKAKLTATSNQPVSSSQDIFPSKSILQNNILNKESRPKESNNMSPQTQYSKPQLPQHSAQFSNNQDTFFTDNTQVEPGRKKRSTTIFDDQPNIKNISQESKRKLIGSTGINQTDGSSNDLLHKKNRAAMQNENQPGMVPISSGLGDSQPKPLTTSAEVHQVPSEHLKVELNSTQASKPTGNQYVLSQTGPINKVNTQAFVVPPNNKFPPTTSFDQSKDIFEPNKHSSPHIADSVSGDPEPDSKSSNQPEFSQTNFLPAPTTNPFAPKSFVGSQKRSNNSQSQSISSVTSENLVETSQTSKSFGFQPFTSITQSSTSSLLSGSQSSKISLIPKDVSKNVDVISPQSLQLPSSIQPISSLKQCTSTDTLENSSKLQAPIFQLQSNNGIPPEQQSHISNSEFENKNLIKSFTSSPINSNIDKPPIPLSTSLLQPQKTISLPSSDEITSKTSKLISTVLQSNTATMTTQPSNSNIPITMLNMASQSQSSSTISSTIFTTPPSKTNPIRNDILPNISSKIILDDQKNKESSELKPELRTNTLIPPNKFPSQSIDLTMDSTSLNSKPSTQIFPGKIDSSRDSQTKSGSDQGTSASNLISNIHPSVSPLQANTNDTIPPCTPSQSTTSTSISTVGTSLPTPSNGPFQHTDSASNVPSNLLRNMQTPNSLLGTSPSITTNTSGNTLISPITSGDNDVAKFGFSKIPSEQTPFFNFGSPQSTTTPDKIFSFGPKQPSNSQNNVFSFGSSKSSNSQNNTFLFGPLQSSNSQTNSSLFASSLPNSRQPIPLTMPMTEAGTTTTSSQVHSVPTFISNHANHTSSITSDVPLSSTTNGTIKSPFEQQQQSPNNDFLNLPSTIASFSEPSHSVGQYLSTSQTSKFLSFNNKSHSIPGSDNSSPSDLLKPIEQSTGKLVSTSTIHSMPNSNNFQFGTKKTTNIPFGGNIQTTHELGQKDNLGSQTTTSLDTASTSLSNFLPGENFKPGNNLPQINPSNNFNSGSPFSLLNNSNLNSTGFNFATNFKAIDTSTNTLQFDAPNKMPFSFGQKITTTPTHQTSTNPQTTPYIGSDIPPLAMGGGGPLSSTFNQNIPPSNLDSGQRTSLFSSTLLPQLSDSSKSNTATMPPSAIGNLFGEAAPINNTKNPKDVFTFGRSSGSN